MTKLCDADTPLTMNDMRSATPTSQPTACRSLSLISLDRLILMLEAVQKSSRTFDGQNFNVIQVIYTVLNDLSSEFSELLPPVEKAKRFFWRRVRHFFCMMPYDARQKQTGSFLLH